MGLYQTKIKCLLLITLSYYECSKVGIRVSILKGLKGRRKTSGNTVHNTVLTMYGIGWALIYQGDHFVTLALNNYVVHLKRIQYRRSTVIEK